MIEMNRWVNCWNTRLILINHFFLLVFLPLFNKSDILFLPCMLVNKWHWQSFESSHKILSLSLQASQNSYSKTCTRKLPARRVTSVTGNIIEVSDSPSKVFLYFNIWFLNTVTFPKKVESRYYNINRNIKCLKTLKLI